MTENLPERLEAIIGSIQSGRYRQT